MSKKLIAGAGVVASFAIALAPLATFATITRNNESDKHTDTLKVTVAPACSFGTVTDGAATDGITHTTGTANTAVDSGTPAAAWTDGADSSYGRIPDADSGTYGTNGETTDVFAYGIYAGTTKDAMATTTLTIFCNNAAGYTLKALTNDLVERNAGDTADATNPEEIPADTSYSAGYTGYAISSVDVSGANGATTSYVSTKFASSTAAEIAQKTSASDETSGDAITMTYGIGIAPSQRAGLYKGNVVYTLFQGFDE